MVRRDLKHAQFALEKVRSVAEDKAKRLKFKTQLVKLPARLHTNGLGQTMALYLAAGGNKEEVQIYHWIETWLRQTKIYPKGSLIDAIVQSSDDERADAERYARASAEARSLATWLKRFAEAFLDDPKTADAPAKGTA